MIDGDPILQSLNVCSRGSNFLIFIGGYRQSVAFFDHSLHKDGEEGVVNIKKMNEHRRGSEFPVSAFAIIQRCFSLVVPH